LNGAQVAVVRLPAGNDDILIGFDDGMEGQDH
jgi:hypothetical protein